MRGLALALLLVARACAQELDCGAAVGDVTADSAVLWARATAPATLSVTCTPAVSVPPLVLEAARGNCGQVALTGLKPATLYTYTLSGGTTGKFVTAPLAADARPVKLVWGADLGGQGHCRGPDGYTILARMKECAPDFALFLGDMIYADSPCPAPPNRPGAETVCRTKDDFRARWIYNRSDPNHRALLASTSMLTTWDDHEVENDFGGTASPLAADGLAAYREFHPLAREKLWRSVRWGKALEVFVLDTRSHRSANRDDDGAASTLLGPEQAAWLAAAVAKSGAVWKIVASSMPLTVPTGSLAEERGRDGWASGTLGSGREREAAGIFGAWRGVTNVVFLCADVHYAQFVKLDPLGDGSLTVHELTCGPLSAIRSQPQPLDPTFHPTLLWAEGDFFNFGEVEAAMESLTVRIRDGAGAVRRTLKIDAK